MDVSEGSLKFIFDDDTEAVKFDDTSFYRKRFNNLPGGKAVDILASSKSAIQFIEIKDCLGYERENMWRIRKDNSGICLLPKETGINDRDSLDIEVAKKVACTLSCLIGAHTIESSVESTKQYQRYFQQLISSKVQNDKISVHVILYLEGKFASTARGKKAIMREIKKSIENKLKWFKCKVDVVDCDTYNEKLFHVDRECKAWGNMNNNISPSNWYFITILHHAGILIECITRPQWEQVPMCNAIKLTVR